MFAIAPGPHREAASVTYYPTFEAREDAFNISVGRLVPSRLAGPERFWADFSEISRRRLDADPTARVAFITSNPRDCLAFATPRQVLTAACLRAGISGGAIAAAVAETATLFCLQANRDQPLRTLSGGESVKLAMAKAAIAGENSCRLSVASPFSWLSAANAGLLDELIERYASRRLPVSVLALAGEDAVGPDPIIGDAAAAFPSVSVALRLETVSVLLATAVAMATTDPARVDFSDAAVTLRSPCLLMGDNGQGKSLLAKLLTGAMAGQGRIVVGDAAGGRRRPRMIFQDVVAQTLSRSADGMLDGLDRADRMAAVANYRELAAGCGAYLDGCQGNPDDPATVGMPTVPSLLEIKLLLAAQRLTGDTSLIILDEPDWGLSRRAAAAFVLAVVAVAHGMRIPVLIISHKPWWTPIARSRLTVIKDMASDDGADNRDGFTVRLIKEL